MFMSFYVFFVFKMMFYDGFMFFFNDFSLSLSIVIYFMFFLMMFCVFLLFLMMV